MLSKINYLSLLLLTSFLLGCDSCEDQGQITVVEGFVTNTTTGNPASNATVVLWVHDRIGTFENFSDRLKLFAAEKTTDSMGYYSLTFFNITGPQHSIQVIPNQKFHCSTLQFIEIGERNIADFSVLPQDTLIDLQFKQIDMDNNPDSVAVSVYSIPSCDVQPFEFDNYVLSTQLPQTDILPVFTQPGVVMEFDIRYFEEGVLMDTDYQAVAAGVELAVFEVEY